MNDPLVAKFTFDESVWLGSHATYYRVKRSRLFWVVAILSSVACVALGLFIMLNLGNVATGSLFVGLPAWLFFERSFFRRRRLRKAFKKLPQRNREVIWRFESERLFVEDGDAHSDFSWRDLVYAAYGRGYLLLFPQDNLFIGIPAAAFASPDDFNRVVELVKMRVAKTKSVR